MEICNATIERVTLGFDRGTIPCAWVFLDYGGSGQGFGGFCLGGPFTHAFVFGILETLGVEKWEDLKGVSCRVEQDHGGVHRIGHFLKDKWFDPKEAFEAMKSEWANVEKEEVS